MFDVNKYQSWRKSLSPIATGSILKWNQTYSGLYSSDDIKEGTHMKVLKIDTSVSGRKVSCEADLVYHLVLCSKNGVERKRQFRFTVEGIAKYLENKTLTLV